MNGHATFLSRRTLYGFLAVVPVLIALGSFVDHPLPKRQRGILGNLPLDRMGKIVIMELE